MNSANKFKKICLLIFAFLMMGIAAKATPTAYAVYSNGTLTFKYGEKPTNETFCFDAADTFFSPQWYELNSSSIYTVIFDSSFSSARPKSCAKWFCEMENLKTIINIEYLNTSNVKDMSYMFSGCSSLTSLDVSGFNTSNVTDMYQMFSGCSSLTSLDVSGFNTSNVTNMTGMFYLCSALTGSLDVSGFNTSKVVSMRNMFTYCKSLTSLDVSGFNTSNVTDMYRMFDECESLTSLDVSGFNTSKVTTMKEMFDGCNKLATIYCNDSWKSTGADGTDMFRGCYLLKGKIPYAADKVDINYATPETGYFTYTKYMTYDLTISGTDVTGENCKDLSAASDLIKGTVSYDPSTKTLYMKNATIEYSGNAISSKIPGLTIKAEGKNVISAAKYSALSVGAGTTTITGDSLELHGGTSAIGFIYGTDSHLIIDGMAELTAEGATHGIRGNLNGSSTTELEVKNGATVRAKGATQSISDIDKLTLGAGTNITTPAGALYKDNGIADASGTAIAGEWVEIGPQKYALWICGKQFTSANSSGITVPNSQGTASYDDETKTLTLTDCVISMDAVSGTVGIKSNMDSLAIHLVGNNSIGMVGTGIECSRNLTIAGPGKLDMMLCGTGIAMTDNTYEAELAICDDAKLSMVLVGTGIVGTYVNKPGHVFFQKDLRISGGNSDVDIIASQSAVSDMNVLTLNDGIALSAPVGAKYSGGDVLDKDGNLVQNKKVRFSHLGDVNNDGAVTMADANAVVNYFLATDKPYSFDVDNANVNGDGDDDGKPSITMADANAIVNMFLGQ